MAAAAASSQLRLTSLYNPPLSDHHRRRRRTTASFPFSKTLTHQALSFTPLRHQRPRFSFSGGDNSGGNNSGGGGDGNDEGEDEAPKGGGNLGLLSWLLIGWRSRVAADPQFPFKVLMEEVVGVSSSVAGDMASRPNFGLYELDFVFSTLVVGSLLNFTLMYLLAPTSAATSSSLPSIFATCPPSHMFEPGQFGIINRLGTLIYKGTVFATVGFAAGLAGTAISNAMIELRKKMDPRFVTPNEAPPTLLNAATWAAHMGVSSNLRYQTLNGVEYVLGRALPPLAFKSSVVVLRCLNNVLGGVTFVMLARLTGSQSAGEKKKVEIGGAAAEKEK